jgi:hypothetical protein
MTEKNRPSGRLIVSDGEKMSIQSGGMISGENATTQNLRSTRIISGPIAAICAMMNGKMGLTGKSDMGRFDSWIGCKHSSWA